MIPPLDRQTGSSSANWGLPVLAIGLAALALWPIVRVGIYNDDDVLAFINCHSLRGFESTWIAAKEQGRVHFLATGALRRVGFLIDHLAYFDGIRIGGTAAVALLAWCLLKKWTNQFVASAGLLLCFGMLPNHEGYNPVINYMPFVQAGLGFFFTACLLQTRAVERANAGCLLGAAICYLACLICSETFVSLFIAFPLITYYRSPTPALADWRTFARKHVLLAASLAFYLGAYLAFRFSHPPQYEGVQLHFAWKVFFGALLRLSLTIGPLLHVFVNTTGVLDAVHTMWHTSPWQALAEVASWPNAAAGLLCGGGLAWATLANTWTVAPRRLFLTLGIGAGVIFLPNVLLSLTPRYQVFAYHTIKVYIYSFHSFLVICAVLGATVVLLPRTLRWGRPATFLWVGLTASIFTGTSVLTTYANRQLAARQFRAHETWKAFQVLLREPDWQAQPPATIVCDEVTDKAPLQWIPTYFADNGASVVFVPVSSADWTRLLQEKPGHAFIFGGTRETASDGLWFWLLPVSGLTNRGEPEGRRLISWRFEAADANSDEWLPTGRKSSLTAPAAFRREMTFPKPVRLAEALRAVAPGNPIR